MPPSTHSNPLLPEDLSGRLLNLQEMQSLAYCYSFRFFLETKKPIPFKNRPSCGVNFLINTFFHPLTSAYACLTAVRACSLILSPAYSRQAQEERRRIRVCPTLPKIQKIIKFNLVFCSVFNERHR